jgi:hypothetical protein
MNLRRWISVAMMILLLGAAPTNAHATPSHAQAYPSQAFKVCQNTTLCINYTRGTIVWYARTADVSGVVKLAQNTDWEWTQASFEAFAGSTKVDAQTRTATPSKLELSIGFPLGDPNLVGGIDRIRITVCSYSFGVRRCGIPVNYLRSNAT